MDNGWYHARITWCITIFIADFFFFFFLYDLFLSLSRARDDRRMPSRHPSIKVGFIPRFFPPDYCPEVGENTHLRQIVYFRALIFSNRCKRSELRFQDFKIDLFLKPYVICWITDLKKFTEEHGLLLLLLSLSLINLYNFARYNLVKK